MNKRALFKHILSLIIFGSNGIIAAHISAATYEIVFFRTVLAFVLMLLIFRVMKSAVTARELPSEIAFICVSGFAMGIEWFFLYEAYREVGVAVGSLMNYTGPAIVLILSPFVFNEKLTLRKVFAFLSVCCGMFLLNRATMLQGATTWGLFCGGMSAVCYAFMVIFNKKASHVTGVENTVIQLFFGLIIVSAFFFYKSGGNFQMTAYDWPWMICLGLLNTGYACYLYFSTFISLPAQSISICGYIEPLCSIIFGAIFLSQHLTFLQIIGAALILGGAVFGTFEKKESA